MGHSSQARLCSLAKESGVCGHVLVSLNWSYFVAGSVRGTEYSIPTFTS